MKLETGRCRLQEVLPGSMILVVPGPGVVPDLRDAQRHYHRAAFGNGAIDGPDHLAPAS